MEKDIVYFDETSPRLTSSQLQELERAIEDVEAGRTTSYENYIKELSAKYGFDD